jgi:ABC-type uncharacterized transport system ATPase component
MENFNVDQVKTGDFVMVVFHDGAGTIFNALTGTLTRWEPEEFVCNINGKPIQLASEGHTTTLLKKI